MDIKADKFTAINFPRLIELANTALVDHPNNSYDNWMDLVNKAHADYDHHGEAIYLLCAMQVFEAQLIVEDPEACACNLTTNGGFDVQCNKEQ